MQGSLAGFVQTRPPSHPPTHPAPATPPHLLRLASAESDPSADGMPARWCPPPLPSLPCAWRSRVTEPSSPATQSTGVARKSGKKEENLGCAHRGGGARTGVSGLLVQRCDYSDNGPLHRYPVHSPVWEPSACLLVQELTRPLEEEGGAGTLMLERRETRLGVGGEGRESLSSGGAPRRAIAACKVLD